MEPLSVEQQIQNILAESKGIGSTEPNLEEQERYLRGYSLGALVYSFFYFKAMKDTLFVWLSLIFSFTIFPALFILPLFARRRAWSMGTGMNFNEFQHQQRKWDKSALYGAIVLVILSYLFLRETSALFQSLLKQNSTSTNTTQQLKDLQNSVQSIGNEN